MLRVQQVMLDSNVEETKCRETASHHKYDDDMYTHTYGGMLSCFKDILKTTTETLIKLAYFDFTAKQLVNSYTMDYENTRASLLARIKTAINRCYTSTQPTSIDHTIESLQQLYHPNIKQFVMIADSIQNEIIKTTKTFFNEYETLVKSYLGQLITLYSTNFQLFKSQLAQAAISPVPKKDNNITINNPSVYDIMQSIPVHGSLMADHILGRKLIAKYLKTIKQTTMIEPTNDDLFVPIYQLYESVMDNISISEYNATASLTVKYERLNKTFQSILDQLSTAQVTCVEHINQTSPEYATLLLKLYATDISNIQNNSFGTLNHIIHDLTKFHNLAFITMNYKT